MKKKLVNRTGGGRCLKFDDISTTAHNVLVPENVSTDALPIGSPEQTNLTPCSGDVSQTEFQIKSNPSSSLEYIPDEKRVKFAGINSFDDVLRLRYEENASSNSESESDDAEYKNYQQVDSL